MGLFMLGFASAAFVIIAIGVIWLLRNGGINAG